VVMLGAFMFSGSQLDQSAARFGRGTTRLALAGLVASHSECVAD